MKICSTQSDATAVRLVFELSYNVPNHQTKACEPSSENLKEVKFVQEKIALRSSTLILMGQYCKALSRRLDLSICPSEIPIFETDENPTRSNRLPQCVKYRFYEEYR
jgi:hypothetical protein